MDSGQVSIKHTRSGQVSLKLVLSFRFDYFLASKERREISQFLLLSTWPNPGSSRVFLHSISFLVNIMTWKGLSAVSAFLCMARQLRVHLPTPFAQAHWNASILFQRWKPFLTGCLILQVQVETWWRLGKRAGFKRDWKWFPWAQKEENDDI